MGKLKAKWEKTDIPKDTKIKLWRIMKDCKTYNDRKAYIAKHEELFDKEEHDKCSAYVRDTFKALEREIKDMPLSEVSSLPDDLQKWIIELRPELRNQLKEEAESKARQDLKKEALRTHFEDIRDLIKRWREQLWPTRENVRNPILGSFSKDDVKLGQHRNAPLNWVIREDSPTTVWLDVEDEPLFEALRIHLPNKELWDEYTELKELLCIETDTLPTVSWKKATSNMEAAEKLVESIDSQLEAEASKSIYPGECRWCPDLD